MSTRKPNVTKVIKALYLLWCDLFIVQQSVNSSTWKFQNLYPNDSVSIVTVYKSLRGGVTI